MVVIKDLLKKIPYEEFLGNDELVINEVVQLGNENSRTDVISWCSLKNISLLNKVSSGTVICPIKPDHPLNSVNYIVTAEPRKAFQRLLELYFLPDQPTPGIEPTSIIDPSCEIANDVYIGHNTVIEKNCKIGKGTIIGHNNVLRSGTVIGSYVRIGSNNTIAAVGFGYEKDEDGIYQVIPHIGNVVLEDHVEIGNNNTIDRAVLGSTILRKHSKVDNLVHIAHGAEIGENSLIIANAMVAGSVKVGSNTWVAPSASILNKVTLGDNVTVGMGAVVLKDIPDNDVVVGSPARSIKKPIQ